MKGKKGQKSQTFNIETGAAQQDGSHTVTDG